MSESHHRRIGRFFLIMTAIVALLHIYIGLRLLPVLAVDIWMRVAAISWLIFSACIIPAAMLARFFVKQQSRADTLAWVGLTAMGFFSSLLVLTFVRDLLLAVGSWLFANKFWDVFYLSSAQWVLGLAVIATVIGFINARRVPAVVNVTIPLHNLPAALENFTLVQISDVHIGPTIKGDYLQAIVDKVNTLNADVIVITGDLVDGSVEQLHQHVAPLKQLRSKHGSYFVAGNHEYYSGAEQWIDFIKTLNIHVLLNQHIILQHHNESIVLAGVTDYSAGQIIPAHNSDVKKSLAGAEHSAAPKILLAHQPRSAIEASEAGFDLQLSGHTHGGQFWPWNFFVPLQQPFTVGLHQLNNMWIYINRGTGYWGPPKRLGSRGEITYIRLIRQHIKKAI